MATIEDVKALLQKGLDPGNTVNQLGRMLADVGVETPPVAEAEEDPEPKAKKRGR